MIDMGSNSWRLVVFGYEPGTPWWSLVDEIREAVRIGAGLDQEGLLRPDRVDRALHTAAVFAAFCQATGVEEIVAVATSAIRDARNGDELLEEIHRTTGLEAHVISGREEARYGWLAIANSTTIEDGFGLDIGGGSIQGLRIEGRRLVESESMPLGAVRVSERFLPDEKASPKQMKALRAHVAGEFERLGWWQGGGRIVGIGGTIRNLAAAAMKRLTLPDIDVQGFQLTREALEELIEELAARPASKRAQVKGIKYDRADVILGGALVLASAMEQGGFDSIEVTEAGLREGIFFERLLGERQLFDDVRARVGPEPRAPLRAPARARPARVDALARDVRRPRRRRAPRPGRRGARAALGRLPAARHRRGGELRRPPPALATTSRSTPACRGSARAS